MLRRPLSIKKAYWRPYIFKLLYIGGGGCTDKKENKVYSYRR
jgi:hypothetical protein